MACIGLASSGLHKGSPYFFSSEVAVHSGVVQLSGMLPTSLRVNSVRGLTYLLLLHSLYFMNESPVESGRP